MCPLYQHSGRVLCVYMRVLTSSSHQIVIVSTKQRQPEHSMAVLALTVHQVVRCGGRLFDRKEKTHTHTKSSPQTNRIQNHLSIGCRRRRAYLCPATHHVADGAVPVPEGHELLHHAASTFFKPNDPAKRSTHILYETGKITRRVERSKGRR